jgi:hypothetical protein
MGATVPRDVPKTSRLAERDGSPMSTGWPHITVVMLCCLLAPGTWHCIMESGV